MIDLGPTSILGYINSDVTDVVNSKWSSNCVSIGHDVRFRALSYDYFSPTSAPNVCETVIQKSRTKIVGINNTSD